jgi:hypothetical protein
VGAVRRAVMICAGVLLLVEALAIGAVNWVLGIVVDRQDMSLGGSDPGITSVGAWTAGGLLSFFLAVVAVVLLITGSRDRALGRVARILVTVCAVFDGVVAVIAAGVIGWAVFGFAVVELGLLVLSLMLVDDDGEAAAPPETGAAAPEGPSPLGPSPVGPSPVGPEGPPTPATGP